MCVITSMDCGSLPSSFPSRWFCLDANQTKKGLSGWRFVTTHNSCYEVVFSSTDPLFRLETLVPKHFLPPRGSSKSPRLVGLATSISLHTSLGIAYYSVALSRHRRICQCSGCCSEAGAKRSLPCLLGRPPCTPCRKWAKAVRLLRI